MHPTLKITMVIALGLVLGLLIATAVRGPGGQSGPADPTLPNAPASGKSEPALRASSPEKRGILELSKVDDADPAKVPQHQASQKETLLDKILRLKGRIDESERTSASDLLHLDVLCIAAILLGQGRGTPYGLTSQQAPPLSPGERRFASYGHNFSFHESEFLEFDELQEVQRRQAIAMAAGSGQESSITQTELETDLIRLKDTVNKRLEQAVKALRYNQ